MKRTNSTAIKGYILVSSLTLLLLVQLVTVNYLKLADRLFLLSLHSKEHLALKKVLIAESLMLVESAQWRGWLTNTLSNFSCSNMMTLEPPLHVYKAGLSKAVEITTDKPAKVTNLKLCRFVPKSNHYQFLILTVLFDDANAEILGQQFGFEQIP